jgi:Domain of unknown function (DUF4159)
MKNMARTMFSIVLVLLVGSMAAGQQAPTPERITLPIPSVRKADTVEKVNPYAFRIARFHYGGGGDWYWGGSALPNLLTFIKEQTGWPIDMEEHQVKIEDQDLFSYPLLFVTGHGTIRFTDDEADRMRKYLLAGGFLFINDSYGMDKSVREAVAKLFPEQKFQEIPYDHPIYHSFYDFPNGPPKIHEHDKKPASGWGIIVDGRIILYYLQESDIGDGWEDPQVHNDPPEKRSDALKMGLNIVAYSMAH